MKKIKNISILIGIIFVASLVFALSSSRDIYQRKQVFETPKEAVENLFNNWVINDNAEKGRCYCTDEFKESLSKRYLAIVNIGKPMPPDNFSYRACLISQKEITDDKALIDIYKANAIEANEPKELKFVEVKYKGYNNLFKETQECTRIFALIKEKDRDGWVIDDFGNYGGYRVYLDMYEKNGGDK